ncbi:hypothetical protein GCWU000324_02525 [Kingella oralis ATCC 51147]|uniref:Uncharacterized protein n=1 Tax=Kingella oralis ATCC 51147 TaxID=629741 RepID=C4GLF4_9NEIS|nr:hypothetical protein GCWU000324_02525 [Kingella oralis ATCC 51147]
MVSWHRCLNNIFRLPKQVLNYSGSLKFANMPPISHHTTRRTKWLAWFIASNSAKKPKA